MNEPGDEKNKLRFLENMGCMVVTIVGVAGIVAAIIMTEAVASENAWPGAVAAVAVSLMGLGATALFLKKHK